MALTLARISASTADLSRYRKSALAERASVQAPGVRRFRLRISLHNTNKNATRDPMLTTISA
jgi:hypothetical protein